jgi:hypothetical protein
MYQKKCVRFATYVRVILASLPFFSKPTISSINVNMYSEGIWEPRQLFVLFRYSLCITPTLRVPKTFLFFVVREFFRCPRMPSKIVTIFPL